MLAYLVCKRAMVGLAFLGCKRAITGLASLGHIMAMVVLHIWEVKGQ